MRRSRMKDNLELEIVVILIIRLEEEEVVIMMMHFHEKNLSFVIKIWSLISKNYILILNIFLYNKLFSFRLILKMCI